MADERANMAAARTVEREHASVGVYSASREGKRLNMIGRNLLEQPGAADRLGSAAVGSDLMGTGAANIGLMGNY